MSINKLWSTSDVSRFLGCCERQVYILRDQGMPTIRVGKKVRFDPERVKAWVLSREEGTTDISPPQLIAAAPELLAALESIIDYAESEAESLSEVEARDGQSCGANEAWERITTAREVIRGATREKLVAANEVINPASEL